jgi:hypothetical protein
MSHPTRARKAVTEQTFARAKSAVQRLKVEQAALQHTFALRQAALDALLALQPFDGSARTVQAEAAVANAAMLLAATTRKLELVTARLEAAASRLAAMRCDPLAVLLQSRRNVPVPKPPVLDKGYSLAHHTRLE